MDWGGGSNSPTAWIRPISRDEVQAADELLLTSATKEVQPVTHLDGKTVGKGVPGPIFRLLFEAYQAEKHSTST